MVTEDLVRRLTRATIAIVALTGVAPVAAQTRVLVSRREVKVLFPRDTMRMWGWRELRDPGDDRAYRWQITLETPNGPGNLMLRIDPADSNARAFRSLASLVAAGRPVVCVGGGFDAVCDFTSLSATVTDGGVVLRLRDSASIAGLFEMRPGSVGAYQRVPYDTSPWTPETVPVEYVAPQIPEPDSAMRAAAVEKRRRYEISIRHISREITGALYGAPLWIALGDSLRAGLNEVHCVHDACMEGLPWVTASGWFVADTSIVVIRRSSKDAAFLVARGIGRTTLRADGLSGPSDTMMSSTPPARVLTRDVLVTVPVDRVTVLPRPDTVVVGSAVLFELRALDREGQVIEGAPVVVSLHASRYSQGHVGPRVFHGQFRDAGRSTLVASLGGRADTLTIIVVPVRKP